MAMRDESARSELGRRLRLAGEGETSRGIDFGSIYAAASSRALRRKRGIYVLAAACAASAAFVIIPGLGRQGGDEGLPTASLTQEIGELSLSSTRSEAAAALSDYQGGQYPVDETAALLVGDIWSEDGL
jgi:hypothetical protein